MSKVEEIQQQYETGLKVLKQFMELSDLQIKEEIKSIVGNDDKYEYLLSKNSDVVRIIKNSVVKNIEIWYYDCIEISPFGIYFKREHGLQTENIVKFSKHFSLNN